MAGAVHLTIKLIGPIRVTDRSGNDRTPTGRKAQAILAALCVAPGGRRGRKWLQGLLWSERDTKQSSDSLRQSVHQIRKSLGAQRGLLKSDRDAIALDLSRIRVDVLSMNREEWRLAEAAHSEFLEGLDVNDPEFDDWLRDQRMTWTADHEAAKSGSLLPAQIAEQASVAIPPMLPQDWSLAVAIMPMRNETGDPALYYVGGGVSEDMIDRLQRVRWLPVIARSSSFSEAGQEMASEDSDFARQLGALYMVSGTLSLGRTGPVVRMRLVETETQRSLWSGIFDLTPMLADGGFDEALDEIIAAIERSVALDYQYRIFNSPPMGRDFQDLIWRGRWHLARLTSSDSAKALAYFEEALSLQPEAPEALIQLSFWHLWRAWVSRAEPSAFGIADRLARRAALADPDDGRSYVLMGIAKSWQRDHEEAIDLFRRSIELTPSLSIAHHQLGSALCLNDCPQDALEPLETALRYSPRDQLDFTYQTELAVALLRLDQTERAWTAVSRALDQKPRYWYGHVVRMVAARRLGDAKRIDLAQRAFQRAEVGGTKDYLKWLPFKSQAWLRELEAVYS